MNIIIVPYKTILKLKVYFIILKNQKIDSFFPKIYNIVIVNIHILK